MKLTAILASVFLLLTRTASGDTSAVDYMRSRHESMKSLVSSGDTRRLSQLLDETLDYEEVARASFGQHWDSLSAQKRVDFIEVMRLLMRKSYERNVRSLVDRTVAWSESGGAVHSVAAPRTPRDEPTEVDYVLVQKSGRYMVVDVVAEGSSLVGNYRRQFDRAIRREGIDVLYRKMKDRSTKVD